MTAIRFTSGTSLPMYGSAVDELHLDVDGAQYVVRVVDGEPVIQPAPVPADTGEGSHDYSDVPGTEWRRPS